MGLINNLLSTIYSKRAGEFVVHWLEPGQVPGGEAREPIRPGGDYLRLDLRALQVPYVRKGLKRYYGMVNSEVALAHRGQGTAQFQAVIAPPELKNVDASRRDRFVSFDRPLAGPVPYRGGDLELQVGLFSVAFENLLEPYVGLLEEIGSKCSVEFINLAMPYAGLLAKGVSLLTGSNNEQMLEIGIQANLKAPRTGWLLVMRADADEFPADRLEKLSVKGDKPKLMEGRARLKDYPYMLLCLGRSPERPDWYDIPELKAQHGLYNEALRSNDREKAEAALRAFELAVFTCPDLLTADATRVGQEAKADLDRLYPPARTTAAPTATAAGKKKAGLRPRKLSEYRIYSPS